MNTPAASSSYPLCSVCVANYNGAGYLSSCIESILNQDFDHTVEIIVHDDASTDNSVSLIKEKYPQVVLLESGKNVGFCISNNRMVDKARGQFILLLNNDAVLREDGLKTLLNANLTHGDGIYGLPQYNAQTGELIDIGSLFDVFLNPVPNMDRARVDVGMIIGACLWIPKEIWVELGGFPDWFGSLAEDMYLCCLARLRGYQVKAMPESGFDHWVGKSLGGGKVSTNGTLATTVKRRTLSERNKTYVMIITYPAPAAFLLMPLHFLLLLLEGSLLSLFKHSSSLWLQIYWACLRQVWTSRKMLLTQREKVQETRSCSTIQFMKPFILVPYKLSMLVKHGLPSISS